MKKITKLSALVIATSIFLWTFAKLVDFPDIAIHKQTVSSDDSKTTLTSFLRGTLSEFYSKKPKTCTEWSSEVPPGLINELKITNSIATIQKAFSEFGLIPLRAIDKEKAVFSCGNSPTSHFIYLLGDHRHSDSITIDYSSKANPTIIANIRDNEVYNYLQAKSHQFSEIFNEHTSERLLDEKSLKNLRKILKNNGLYKLTTGIIGIKINKKLLEKNELEYRCYDDKEISEQKSEIYRFSDKILCIDFSIFIDEENIKEEHKERLKKGDVTKDFLYEILSTYFLKNGFAFERPLNKNESNAFEIVVKHKNGNTFGIQFFKDLCLKRLD